MASAGSLMMREHFTNLMVERLPFIDEILDANLNLPDLSYPGAFDVRDSSRAFEQVQEITGLGLFGLKSEGDTVSYDAVMQGWHKKLTHATYGKAVAISMEASDDDIDDAISNIMPPLGASAQSSIETFAWNVYNNGFSSETTGDGAYLFSAAHVLKGGGTASNLITNSDFSVSTLETALALFDNQVNERGLPVQANVSQIIFPTGLRWLVHEVLKSELRSDTANNAVNAFSQVNIDPLMSKYLTGADDWFLRSVSTGNGPRLYWRMEPMSDHTIDFDTGNLKTKMIFRLSAGPTGWRDVIGAQGA